MFEPNIPLLRKAVEWTETQEKLEGSERQWNQNFWINRTDCGTTYCVAGYIALSSEEYKEMAFPQMGTSGLIKLNNGEMEVVSDLAAQELGIDPDVASDEGGLFDASNTASDVRRIAEELAGERL